MLLACGGVLPNAGPMPDTSFWTAIQDLLCDYAVLCCNDDCHCSDVDDTLYLRSSKNLANMGRRTERRLRELFWRSRRLAVPRARVVRHDEFPKLVDILLVVEKRECEAVSLHGRYGAQESGKFTE